MKWCLYVAVVKNRRAKLSKSLKDRGKREAYLNQPFVPPTADRKRRVAPSDGDATKCLPLPKKPAFDTLCEGVVEMTSRKILDDHARIQQISQEQTGTINRLEKENRKLKLENKTLKHKLACGTD